MDTASPTSRRTKLSGPVLRIGTALRLLPLVVLGLIAGPLRADQFGDFTYTNNTTHVTITGYTGSGGEVEIPSTIVGLQVTHLANYAFYYKPITSIEIPASVTNIGYLTLSGMNNLTSIIVDPANTTFSGVGGVLFNATQTTLIQYPGGKTGVYTIPSTVTTIGSNAFSYTGALSGVNIPTSVTTISANAFAYCNGPISILIPSSVTTIGEAAFRGMSSLAQINVDTVNPNFSSLAGVLFNKNQTILLQHPQGKTVAYNVPPTVTAIGAYAFSNCGIPSVTLPSSLVSIGFQAFYNCYNLSSVTIPANVTSIGAYPFLFCFGLTSITVDPLNPAYSSLDGVLFNYDKTTLITYPQGKSGAYQVPVTVFAIEASAFYYCQNLTSVIIPVSVSSIGSSAFSYCSQLASATFEGDAPYMDYGVFFNTASGFTVYFYEAATGFTTPTWEGYPSEMLTGGGGGMDFRIATLETTNSSVVDHTLLTGDDRGGIAITQNVVLVSGDFYTGYYQASDLSGPTSLGLVQDGMCSDLATRKLYLLTNNGVPHSGGSSNQINRLLEYDPEAYAYPNQIDLSQSIPIPAVFSSICGVFSGYRRIVIHNGTNVYDIQIPSGTVTDLGPMTKPNWQNSESWAIWGVAECFNGGLQLAYRQNASNSIVRSRVPDGATETIATFTNLADMANWTVDPVRNRWYFHYEGSAQFGGSEEMLGYADATFQVGGGGAGSDLADAVDAPSLTFTTGGTANWARQTVITHDGIDAAASGNISDNQESWMETTVTGPGTISFWWSVASDPNDILGFYVNGVLQTGTISGNVPWGQRSYVFGAGTHTLRWRYSKDFFGDWYSDTAWVDEVVWTPGGGGNPADFTYTTSGGIATVTGYTGSGGAVTIPATLGGFPVTAIGANAFSFKPSLTSVTMPASVTTIGNSAFSNCYNLETVTLGPSLASIGDYAFTGLGASMIVIPPSVTSIGVEAFYASDLTAITIPAALTTIGARAFKYCRAMQSFSVDVGNPNYSSLGGVLFNKNLTLLIQYPLAKIGAYSVPNGVVTIGDSAFAGAYDPTSVSLPSSVLNIEDEAFYSCLGLQSINVDSGNPNFSSLGGVLFNKNQTTLLVYPGGKVGAYTIPSGVTAIAKNSFAYCWKLTAVTIPEGVVSIGDTAFYYSELTSLTFPATLTSLGESVFAQSSYLLDVHVAAGNTFYSSIDGVLFNEDQTNLIYFPEARTGSYSIPQGTQRIEEYAFGRSEISEVSVPASVTEMEDYAFIFARQLESLVFAGNAPLMGTYSLPISYYAHENFTTYFYQGASGFTTPTWYGYPSQMIPGGNNFANWATAGGLTGNNALPGAIPHSDGVPNLLKFAFGLNPSGPDARRMVPGGTVGLPVGYLHQSGGTVWRVEYLRRKNSGLTYTPKKSTSLTGGSFMPLIGTPVVSEIVGFPDWQRVTVDEPYNPATTPKMFTTVEVTGE